MQKICKLNIRRNCKIYVCDIRNIYKLMNINLDIRNTYTVETQISVTHNVFKLDILTPGRKDGFEIIDMLTKRRTQVPVWRRYSRADGID